MAGSTGLRDELDVLRAELRKTSVSKGAAAAAAPVLPEGSGDAAQPVASAADFEEQLRELGRVLSEHTGSAEDFVAEHAFVSVLAAFALGVAVGRLMGRT
jgi:ElaB/YqjD/DUF883 family membrane-anchored ribosome-binding protein